MPKNILCNEYPSQSIAEFSGTYGRAIVETADGKVYSFDMDRQKGERFIEEGAGFHARMWLPIMSQLRFLPAGEYPFTELEKQLESEWRIANGE